MTTIYADFNARTRDDRVRLTTVGSKKSLEDAGLGAGAWVWLSDGEVRNGAVIEESVEGLVARVAWEMTEDVVGEVPPSDAAAALQELRAQMQGTERDYRRLLRSLPVAERMLDEGRGDYLRSRAAEAFGYPQLALLAIEDALRRAPERPAFLHQRLELLKRIDLERAFAEASALTKRSDLPAMVVAACASILHTYARTLDDARASEVERELVTLTDRLDESPDYQTAPRSVTAMVHVTRAFALLHLGDRDRALVELDRAVESNPDRAEALAARGLERYPSPEAVHDLLRAVELGFPSFWPAYYLSHHFIGAADWTNAERFASSAYAMHPPSRVRANLIEWQAISRFQQDGDAQAARESMRRALDLAPDNEHLKKNLATVEALSAPPTPKHSWILVRDSDKRTRDLAA